VALSLNLYSKMFSMIVSTETMNDYLRSIWNVLYPFSDPLSLSRTPSGWLLNYHAARAWCSGDSETAFGPVFMVLRGTKSNMADLWSIALAVLCFQSIISKPPVLDGSDLRLAMSYPHLIERCGNVRLSTYT
jgi:hypothetical protein